MKKYFILLLIIAALVSCRKEETEGISSSEIILKSSSSEFQQLFSGISPVESDPFDLKSITIEGDVAKITVAYSGGCRKHTFEIIWSESLTATNPPRTDLLIIHNANGDMCEAYITDTLIFNVSDFADTLSLGDMFVNVINGSDTGEQSSSGGYNPADTLSYDDGRYDVVFTQGDICLVPVTAMKVICGTGLWNNTWFALDDSVSAGIDGYYFRKYLQPVSICSCNAAFVPVPGKRYLIGARIQREHPYLAIPVCLAYSGPSEPVRITCIKELN